MWDYTDETLDHFRNPRNIGRIKDADGVGEVGSVACGDALTLTFKMDDNGKIADAKFQTFGCASAIASSSVLTEMLIGLTIDEAKAITNKKIAESLGGLPEQKMHCSVMGKEALDEAINYYENGGKKSKTNQENIICTCFGVTDKEITTVIAENGLTTVEQVTNYTKAGGGCGGCIPQIEEILEKTRSEIKDENSTKNIKEIKKLTNIQKIQLIQETIEREIRPRLKNDGGNIDLIDVDGHRVIVALRGTCANCQVAKFTLKDVVENKLHEFVSPDIVVEEA